MTTEHTHEPEHTAATEPEPSLDEQIAEAEAAGDWTGAGALKLAGALEAHLNQEPPSNPELADEIAEAEASGDWAKAAALKLRAASAPAVAPNAELDQQIAEAEEAGNWAEAGRLKLEKIGWPTV